MSERQVLSLGKQAGSRGQQLRAAIGRRTDQRGIILLLVVCIVALFVDTTVFTAYEATLSFIALTGLLALGLTAVILMGELDLSIASTLAVSGVVMASFDNLALGIVVALASGVVIGIINAFMVVKIGINSFIATLGTLFALQGIAFVISDEKPVRIGDSQEDVQAGLDFGKELIGSFTPRILIFVLAFVLLHIFVSRVRAGREFYAVGGNRQAARDAGIPVNRRIFTGFMISGFVAALGGVINTLELTTADPTAGGTLLLVSFAAAIVGGNLLKGGRGSIFGTMVGVFALGVMTVLLKFQGIQVDIQQIFIGGVLLLAVITDPASLRSVGQRIRVVFTESNKKASAPEPLDSKADVEAANAGGTPRQRKADS